MNLRLKQIEKMVDANTRLADIGTDHAYLPIELVRDGKIQYAIASDISKGPLLNAENDIKAAGLANKIDIRLGNGLNTIKKEDKIQTVVIAGMGGKLMVDILNEAWLKRAQYENLILEPNVGEMQVRDWLMIHGYEIIAEKMLAEAGHTYEIIKARLVKQVLPLTESELFFGPKILNDKEPVFYQKWQRQLAYYNKLLANLNRAKKPDTIRIKQLEHWIKLIKEQIND